MSKFLVIDYLQPYNYDKDNFNFFNENNNECILCYKELNNNSLLLVNNFCNCYKLVLICDKCFLKWFNGDCKCFICRKSYKKQNQELDKSFLPGDYMEKLLIDKNIKITINSSPQCSINNSTQIGSPRDSIYMDRIEYKINNLLNKKFVNKTYSHVIELNNNINENIIINDNNSAVNSNLLSTNYFLFRHKWKCIIFATFFYSGIGLFLLLINK